MATTLTFNTTTVTLPDDIFWRDQHSWSPIEQSVETSITGAAIIDVGERLAMRPITLESDETFAWFSYAVVAQLKNWAALPDCQMSLNIQGTAFNVIFRHQDKPAIDVEAVVSYNAPDNQDWFFGTIKLMEV